jgi:undecaprenyl-diphosphatase
VVTEKLLGLDPSSPTMTLLLVMLHTGTMFAVIVYFWPQWRRRYFQSAVAFKAIALRVILATVITAVVGGIIVKIIESTIFRDLPHAQIEDLFSHLEIMAPALAAAGILILVAGILERRRPAPAEATADDLNLKQAGLIGPFRGCACRSADSRGPEQPSRRECCSAWQRRARRASASLWPSC